jgi:hypothetical protein
MAICGMHQGLEASETNGNSRRTLQKQATCGGHRNAFLLENTGDV